VLEKIYAHSRSCKKRLQASCLSVRTEQLGSHWTDFHEIWYLGNFRKISRENSSFIKIRQNYRALYMKTNIHFLSYLAQFFLEWEMFQTKVVQKIKTHILCSVTFPQISCRLWDNVEKYCRAGQATDGNMTLAQCTLDT